MTSDTRQLSLDDLFEPSGEDERRPSRQPADAARRPARGHYVPEWEREHRRLSAYRRRARKADGAPWSVDEEWPLLRPSLAHYRLIRRVERELERCGCDKFPSVLIGTPPLEERELGRAGKPRPNVECCERGR